MSWQLADSKQAQEDAKKLTAAGLKPKAEELLYEVFAKQKTVRVLRMWTHYE